MDQNLKERLVGLGVLLLLGVIFIPWVLDGDKSEQADVKNLKLPVPSSSVTHELDFESGNVRRIDLPVPVKANIDDSAAPVQSTNSVKPLEQNNDKKSVESAPTISETELGVINRDPDAKVLSPQESLKAPASNTAVNSLKVKTEQLQSEIDRVASDPSAAWVVQIGSFGDRKNAEKVVSELKAKGFPAFLSRFATSNNTVLYRVRVGPEKERMRADKLAERLLKAGSKGQVVAHP